MPCFLTSHTLAIPFLCRSTSIMAEKPRLPPALPVVHRAFVPHLIGSLVQRELAAVRLTEGLIRSALRRVRRRARQDELGREIIARTVGEKLPAEQLQDRLARAQADVVALDARKLAARAVGKADVQPLALALGQNGQACGGVGVLFDVRQEVIRHALEHLHVGRDGAGRGQQQEVDVKAPAAQLGRALAELRKEENLTQAEFAAQFNYSDKAVSKWERGDSLPDVVMLKTIADLYGLRVDDLLTDGGVAAAYAAATESGGEKQHDAYLMSKVLIAAMWVTMVWVVAVVVFLYSQFSIGKMYWMAFVWAVPVSFAVAFLFSRHWEGETTLQCVFSSLFVWSTITAFYFQYLQYNIWAVFFVGVPVQIALILGTKLHRAGVHWLRR